ncbi:hypothetical protein LIER_37708 [Lithospermum erythrorhizon]|uniref:RNase H type-1 domain-containing protein n=1 Tax=Lithospermum erythrorhizon TaxID=34254 RepID=A0AAV3PPI0_LITER
MQAPKSYKEVQCLSGSLVGLNRFILRPEDKNLPFFRKLTFEELKAYLGSLKILTRPEGKKELQLYLAISKGTLSSVLIREEEKIQKPIYYVSHVLHGLEENYHLIDKFVLALVTSARKLKTYFENHPIAVVTKQPLKRILSNPAQTGRLTKWAIELSKFEITFIPRTGIKAQALVDFVIECTARDLPEDTEHVPTPPELPLWTLYVDGASNPKGVGAGILIQRPEDSCFEYALRFLFQAMNNEVEYKAMVTGLLLAQSLGISRIMVRGYSKLVIVQIREDCGVKNESLRKYHAKATIVVLGFDYVIFEHIPRGENEHVDHLSRLAMTYYEDIPRGVYIEHRERPMYDEARIFLVGGEEKDWRSPIVKFFTTGDLLEDKVVARKLQNRSHKLYVPRRAV